jgi:hypothetical protein
MPGPRCQDLSQTQTHLLLPLARPFWSLSALPAAPQPRRSSMPPGASWPLRPLPRIPRRHGRTGGGQVLNRPRRGPSRTSHPSSTPLITRSTPGSPTRARARARARARTGRGQALNRTRTGHLRINYYRAKATRRTSRAWSRPLGYPAVPARGVGAGRLRAFVAVVSTARNERPPLAPTSPGTSNEQVMNKPSSHERGALEKASAVSIAPADPGRTASQPAQAGFACTEPHFNGAANGAESPHARIRTRE